MNNNACLCVWPYTYLNLYNKMYARIHKFEQSLCDILELIEHFCTSQKWIFYECGSCSSKERLIKYVASNPLTSHRDCRFCWHYFRFIIQLQNIQHASEVWNGMFDWCNMMLFFCWALLSLSQSLVHPWSYDFRGTFEATANKSR